MSNPADKVERWSIDRLVMELDPRFVDVIVKRWQDFTGRKATLEDDGRTFEEVADGRTQAEAHAA
mgnify:CR=1 FL=1